VAEVRAEVRNILAPIVALTGVSLLLIYAASCSSGQSSTSDEPIAQQKPAEGRTAEAPDLLQLGKFVSALPKPILPKPKPPAAAGPLVAEFLDTGCSTTVVRGLSEQIIAEGNCIEPGAFTRVPQLSNVSFGKAVFPYMMSHARAALLKAAKRGKRYKMKVNSMLRTVVQQYLLYQWYERGRCGIKLAARPGASNHQSGLAIDISSPGTWKRFLKREGFRWLGKKDRWHFDFIGKKAKVEGRKGLDMQAFQRLWNRNHPNEPIEADGGWGPDTEQALRRAPTNGFAVGAVCRFGDGDE